MISDKTVMERWLNQYISITRFHMEACSFRPVIIVNVAIRTNLLQEQGSAVDLSQSKGRDSVPNWQITTYRCEIPDASVCTLNYT